MGSDEGIRLMTTAILTLRKGKHYSHILITGHARGDGGGKNFSWSLFLQTELTFQQLQKQFFPGEGDRALVIFTASVKMQLHVEGKANSWDHSAWVRETCGRTALFWKQLCRRGILDFSYNISRVLSTTFFY